MGPVEPIVAGRVRQVEVVLTAAAAPERKVIPIRSEAPASPNGDGAELVSLFEAQKTIHPRSVSGRFARWRWVMVWLTQLVFYGLPWIEWGQRQAVLFDLGARRFYIFGLVLYPQDFIYLTGLLVASALSLFLFTALAGRLWCGYACPQTVYTEIFMWIERRIEGDRSARLRLEAAPWSVAKLARKSAKHLAWLVVALWTGFTFVGYFSPLRDLTASLHEAGLAGLECLRAAHCGIRLWGGPAGSWEAFWVLFYGIATYGNAGFLREQVCMYMCPYARFQSAMFDRDTMIVSYDQPLGEPRGSRSRKADPAALGLGSCIDCTLCVQVCPTGIDIRKGLQYECIACGACADVCDEVMDKMGYARGLVRYATQNAMHGAWSVAQIWRRAMRPRVLVYAALLSAVGVAMAAGLWLRTPFKVDVVRDRGALARIVQGGMLENVYRLQIMNATETAQRYRLGASGLAGLHIASDEVVQVEAAQSRWVAVRLRLPYASTPPGSQPMRFDIESLNGGQRISEKSVFIVPR